MQASPKKTPSIRTTRFACYLTNIAMAAVGALSPLLFVTFRELYNISYSLLGLLVVVNFCTQLTIDLIFSFFSHKFPIRKTIRFMPYLTVIGLLIYALLPLLFSQPQAVYLCLVIGTVIFSCSAGLAEVLISPLVAALPSDNPERDMSRLHSTYAWGLVGVVIFGSLFLKLVGEAHWWLLALAFALIPTTGAILFSRAPIPDMETNKEDPSTPKKKNSLGSGLLLCVCCIFLGGAAEGTMTQWVSSYVETALTLPKLIGDILGMALFAVTLGVGRTLYAKFGKHILRIMLLGMTGATACYLCAALLKSPMAGLIACVMTGLCVSMLWPGSIILVETKFPAAGVAAYALMAAGGDMGSAVAPQLMGLIADAVSASPAGIQLAQRLAMTPEQIGMRAGLLSATFFPLLGIVVVCVIMRYFKRKPSSK